MKHPKRLKDQWRDICADLTSEDGIPVRRKEKRKRDGSCDRKTLALCAQIKQTINLVLAGECADPLLQQLIAITVEPAPDATRLHVTVTPALPDQQLNMQLALQRINSARGRLRFSVAQAIHRKRTPELSFCVLPYEETES